MVDRFVFFVFITLLGGLTWFTLSFVDNHEKWEKCCWAPHEFNYTGKTLTKKWGMADLYTCRNCGFQYVCLHGVSTNGETENVMAIKSVLSNDFDECYIEYCETFSLPKYIRVKDVDIKSININKNGKE